MILQRVRKALLAAMLVAAAALPVRADDDKKPAPGTPAPEQKFCTVKVKEWVNEPYTCTVTKYKTVCKEEKYTAYKCESVPEKRTCTKTVYTSVPETKDVTRTVVTCVPVCEEKTIQKACYHWQNVTVVEKKCVDKGHYECKEEECGPSLSDRLHKLTSRHSCCSCETACEAACPRTKTVKVWVPCPTYVDVTRCKRERVCETHPETVKVTTYKRVEKQETVKVTTCKLVAEQKTEEVTVMVQKKTPYEATRMVQTCVPVTETIQKCRKVCREVEKQVPVTPCCEPTACCKPHRFSCFH